MKALVVLVLAAATSAAAVEVVVGDAAVFVRDGVVGAGAPLGFSAERADEQRKAEQRLAEVISGERLSNFHRALTRRPHIAGTPEGEAMAKEIARLLREMGHRTELRTYKVYLSHPRRIRVTLLGRKRIVLPVREPPDPRDPDTAQPGLTPGFVAYSASGRVEGPVVYVNYGLPSDYDSLARIGVNVRGAVVLARYGKVHRAVKVHTAETRGARGIVIYSDPADDGYAQGEVWPEGPWRAPTFVQRGNAKYSWFWHGDPLTPGVAATPEAVRLDPAEAPTLPRIPAAVLPWSQARKILSRLGGAVVPKGFQGGLPFTYHSGPGPAVLELDVRMESGLRPITNVLARIEGREEPDRWVVLGTHHDAWTFGGVDPGSSAAALLEAARALADLAKKGWRPRRTIVLGFWDAEEYGLLGSTEFAEEREQELREKAVAYVNSDLYLAGRFEAGGTASLRDFVADLARAVARPAGSGSVYDAWREEAWRSLAPAEKRRLVEGFEVELEPLGSGADFVPFQAFLGLPTLSLEFGIEGSYGAYHSIFDTRVYVERHGDPGWRYGRALAELLGRAAMRLASADVLPLRLSHTAERIRQSLDRLEADNVDPAGRPRLEALDLTGVRDRVAALARAARGLEAGVDSALAGKGPEPAVCRELNDRLARAEKAFVDAEADASGRPRWYRHTLYGWDIYALYSGQSLPALRGALLRGDAKDFAAERGRLERALERAAEELSRAAALLR